MYPIRPLIRLVISAWSWTSVSIASFAEIGPISPSVSAVESDTCMKTADNRYWIFWRDGDYYEATNHIPPYATQLTIRVEREARRRTISWQRADYAQFHPDRARFRWLHLECGQHDFVCQPCPHQPGSRGPAHRRTRGSRGAYAAPDRFTANQY